MERHNGFMFDILLGVFASVIAVLAGTYIFRTEFTNIEVMRNFVTGFIASFIARKTAKKLNIRAHID